MAWKFNDPKKNDEKIQIKDIHLTWQLTRRGLKILWFEQFTTFKVRQSQKIIHNSQVLEPLRRSFIDNNPNFVLKHEHKNKFDFEWDKIIFRLPGMCLVTDVISRFKKLKM
jgi:hypothetical protein